MKKLTLLGSTGSIGVTTLEIVAEHPELFEIKALTAGKNLSLLKDQIDRFKPQMVAVPNKECAQQLSTLISSDQPKILWGVHGLISCAAESEADMVVSAIVGSAGLEPTLAAIHAGLDIALANKETLVIAGNLVMDAVQKSGCRLFPIDSEHSAIYQSLQGHRKEDVRRLILTASGGPFLNRSFDDLLNVKPQDALQHPNWTMGRKITIDSATMMNKGLEIIEAHWLFDLPVEKIDVHIHPESIVHSMVEYIDGAIIAQLGIPDMKTPIAYALNYPQRLSINLPQLDLCKLGQLHFSKPDIHCFPCLEMAYQAMRAGGTMPAVLNAANEVAVDAFLQEDIGFLDIPRVISNVMGSHAPSAITSLEQVLNADKWGRRQALKVMEHIQGASSL